MPQEAVLKKFFRVFFSLSLFSRRSLFFSFPLFLTLSLSLSLSLSSLQPSSPSLPISLPKVKKKTQKLTVEAPVLVLHLHHQDVAAVGREPRPHHRQQLAPPRVDESEEIGVGGPGLHLGAGPGHGRVVEPPRQPSGVDLGADVGPRAQEHPQPLCRRRVEKRLEVERAREVEGPGPEGLVERPHGIGLDRVDPHGREAAEAVAPVGRVGALVVVPVFFFRFFGFFEGEVRGALRRGVGRCRRGRSKKEKKVDGVVVVRKKKKRSVISFQYSLSRQDAKGLAVQQEHVVGHLKGVRVPAESRELWPRGDAEPPSVTVDADAVFAFAICSLADDLVSRVGAGQKGRRDQRKQREGRAATHLWGCRECRSS